MATIVLGTEDSTIWATFDAELGGLGHTVVWAATGQEVYDACLATPPDAVLLCPNLRVFDGFACCEILRNDPEISNALPIVLLTDEEPNPHDVEKAGFTGRFPETHSVQYLAERLSNWLMGTPGLI
ncbi:MAG: hypothetical protein HYV27_02625 [Candidatus Hydrogenedentes bacterium]|nr:hypothetical protein [Candidatus Hydrogenedentota bacterium]